MYAGQSHSHTHAACSRQADKVLLFPHAGYDTVAALKALVPMVNAVTVGMVSGEEQPLLPEKASMPFQVNQVACG